MEKKINIAELLKDCPKGMELDCTMYDNLFLSNVNKNKNDLYPIICYTICNGIRNIVVFTEFGEFNRFISSKCVIFPKGKATWEGFQRPFVDGDIVFFNDTISIFKEWGDETLFRTYVTKYLCCDSVIDINVPLFSKSVRNEIRFATEEEKQKLFQAIKDKGYKWNTETKTLEKLMVPKFKIGDRIRHKIVNFIHVITGIKDEYYIMDEVSFPHGILPIEAQNEYELVPDKFDVTTLKHFDKVLVRLTNNCIWMPKFFSHYDPKVKYYPFVTLDNMGYPQCIPYKGNEHLSRTTNDCNEFYKIWQ